VTGASRGIGRAVAEGLAAEGARLVIAARGTEALEETQRALEASGAEVLAVTGDRASWDASLNVDVMGAVRLVEAVLPLIIAEGGGSILLVSSISAIEAAPMEEFGYTAAWPP